MSALGKALIVAGGVLVLLGAVLLLGERIPSLGHLPGDIRIKGERFSFCFPLATCILLSVVLTLIVNVVVRLFFRGR